MSNEMHNPDDIVISGISGVFPNCENIAEFQQNLFSGKNLISSTNRFNANMQMGLVKTIDRFDYTFFHMTRSQAEKTTISSRILLEKTFEAILDAGYNPQELKGKNIAVACGIWDHSDKGDPAWENDVDTYEIFNSTHFMAANKISNWLDIHGPSFAINSACSSSMYALDIAIEHVKLRKCDGAIVCAPNFCFSMSEVHTKSAIHSLKGNSSPFDINASGYVRSEAVVVIFLQRRRDARRLYANVIHSMTNCDGFKEEGYSHPSVEQQKQLYHQFYKEINVDPQSIYYIETHGTGTQVGDTVEGTSIEEFFCKDRKTPLKIGTSKSNIGHTEAAAALCGVAKLIIAFETGLIPPNVNFKTPNPNIKGLLNGNLEVLVKPTPLEGEYFALSSFGIGGANGHLLLTPHDKLKTPQSMEEAIPRIVAVSGRTEEAIVVILNDIEKHRTDVEYIALMHKIFNKDISGHLHRGYIILHKNKEHPPTKSKSSFTGEKRPIWFIFSGMGSQWPTMGKSLMSIPLFAESIRKSHQVLQTKGLNLIRVITEDGAQTFDNILHSFVGIAAIQIALVDVLKALQIEPDGIIGHSVGELRCAYADGCFTAKQMILAAYYRGLASVESELIHGTMAAVGEGYNTIKDIVPEGIDVACHNSPASCTISGPTDMMKDFIQQLKQKKIFVREVHTSNIPYHSRYIAPAAKPLMKYLKQIISEPKLRSDKWVCTSAPESLWNADHVKYSCADYYVNNLLNTVYFEEGCYHIPSNAITIEIAPHGLLNAILKHSLPTTVKNIPLTMRNHEDNVEFFLNSVGRMYEAGCTPQLSNLYPVVEFPVSRSTPMISSLIRWQHDEQWPVGILDKETVSSERIFLIQMSDEKTDFLKDHIIDGRKLYPGVGYLWLALESIAMMRKTEVTETSVIFEKIRFERTTVVPEKGALKFQVMTHMPTNTFAITQAGEVIAKGKIRIMEDTDQKDNSGPTESFRITEDSSFLNTKDFYKELRIRGYGYKGLFKQVVRVNCEGTYGEIWWHNNFITFMDTMAQIGLIRNDCRELAVPTFVNKISIDFKKHFKALNSLDAKNPKFPVTYNPHSDLICSGGIEMSGWKCKEIPRRTTEADPVLETNQFVPYISNELMELELAVRICVQIALENSHTIQVKTYELFESDGPLEVPRISRAIVDTLRDLPLLQANVKVLMNSKTTFSTEELNGITITNDKLPSDNDSLLITLANIRKKTHVFEEIFNTLKDNGFIIAKESIDCDSSFKDIGLNICFNRVINAKERILLLNKIQNLKPTHGLIPIQSNSYTWIPELQKALSSITPEQQEKLVLYAEKDSINGILGLFNCLRKEDKGTALRCFFMMCDNSPSFSLENSLILTQFEKNLSHNVYKDQQWGSYRHLKLNPINNIETNNALCTLEEQGNLSSLKWVESSANPLIYENIDGISFAHLYYSGLNFRDVMLSLGKISPMDTTGYHRLIECYQGIEYSGRDKNGARIMGITNHGGIATTVKTYPNTTWAVPDTMTLEEAATIPVVYSTIIYGFYFKMNLRRGSSVLIHAGSGGIGQAAINICLNFGCNIFTTVGTPEKVEFIQKTFPQIPRNHIGNSRNTSFYDLVMEQTEGKGVDVVLNSLSEEKLEASVRCVAKSGHLIEIGKFDMAKRNSLELSHFLNDISYHSIQLDLFTRSENFVYIRDKLTELLNQGAIKPIKRIVFQPDQVESAFRFMAAGKHIGKVLIKIRDEEKDHKLKPNLVRIPANPAMICEKAKTYLIIGGLGGFGMELTDWLILRGARNIVLSSRTGIKNGYQTYRINLWRSYGVNVVISTEDVTKETGVQKLLQTANSLGSVAGIFNLAVILKDDPFLQQTEETFILAGGPKATATVHLDKFSRDMCPFLEYFVVFSSVSCGRGNYSQTNYAYSNSIMERICEKRHRDNLPATAIQWGAIGDVGIVADFAEDSVSVVIGGTLQQKLKSCLNTLNLLMKQPHPVVSSMIVAEKRQGGSNITDVVTNILGIKNFKNINPTWTLPELGMDSLTAVEIKQNLESEFGIIFTPEQLRSMTFTKLIRFQEEKENKSADKTATPMQFFIEKLITKPILRLPVNENNIDAPFCINGHPTVFLFPGIEGIATSMEKMAENLPVQTLCFQYYFQDLADFSLDKLHEYFAQYILENLAPNQEFYLIGHSFGGCMAMQVANALENKGRKGYVCMIESSPSLVKAMFGEYWQKSNTRDEEFQQNKVCAVVTQIFKPEINIKNFESLKDAKDWESKKKLCSAMLRSVLLDEDVIHQLLEKTLLAFKAAHKYEIPHDMSLQSRCILIRSVESLFKLDECYGLSEYFKNPLQVHKIDADHFSILLNSKTTEILLQCPALK